MYFMKVLSLAALAAALASSPARAQDRPDVEAPPLPPSTAPATGPAAQTMEPQISAEAKPVVEQMRQAYEQLDAVKLEGTISREIDLGDKQDRAAEKFVSSFKEPNFFRHTLGEDTLTVGSTGAQVYAHSKQDNSYLLEDAPDAQAPPAALPQPVPQLLEQQNPSLLLALERDPMRQLGPVRIDKGEDVKLDDGKTYSALKIVPPGAQAQTPTTTILVDPQTHLIRRISTDMAEALREGGLPNVKTATTTIDYTTVAPDAQFDPDHFAWSPPEGASDIRAAAPQGGQGAEAMVGKPAPAFELPSLDGKPVSLADAGNDVVLLDFWATWCPPCVESLPHLAELHGEEQEGLKVYAINLQEDEQKVRDFLSERKLQIPVLLDKQGEVAQQYGVTSIPQTVLIDGNGTVRRVWVGFGPDMYSQVRQEIRSLHSGGAAPAAAQQPPKKQD